MTKTTTEKTRIEIALLLPAVLSAYEALAKKNRHN